MAIVIQLFDQYFVILAVFLIILTPVFGKPVHRYDFSFSIYRSYTITSYLRVSILDMDHHIVKNAVLTE